MKNRIGEDILEHIDILCNLKGSLYIENIEIAIKKIICSLKNGGKILLIGNGGSAADAQHFAAELVGSFEMSRMALPAISLVTDSSSLTAIGNDFGFNYIFSRQIEAIGNKEDILVAISTSGNSQNVIEAIRTAKKNSIYTIGMTGIQGGKLLKECDITLLVNSQKTCRIQEVHEITIHIICKMVEEFFATYKKEN